jgi:sugar phosphate permease
MGGVALGALLLMLFLPASHAPLALPVVVILYGASGLGWSGIYQTLAAELAGSTAAGVSVGMANSFIYVGSVVMTPFCGYLADSTGSFRSAWSILSLGLLCGVILLGRIRPVQGSLSTL